MLKYILVIVILGFHNGFATSPNLLQHSQLSALNERMNQMIQALYSSPFLSSIAKTKSSLRSQQSSNDYEPYTPPYQAEPLPPPPQLPMLSSPPIPASPPMYSQPPPENSNVIYISPKSAASPPSVTISRTKYPPAEYRYPVEYREQYLPTKAAVDPEEQRQEYYRSYYQHPASTATKIPAPETPVYDYSYYYPEAERPLRVGVAPEAQQRYLAPAPSVAEVPATVNSGYAASPSAAYESLPSTAYAAPPSTTYAAPVPPNPNYLPPAPPSSAYASPVPLNTAYTAVPSNPAYGAPLSPAYPAYAAPNPANAAPNPAYASPNPENPAYAAPNPAYAAPNPASPAYASPNPANPAYAAPNPAYASPVPASPAYASPVSANLAYAAPNSVNTAYAAPVPENPAYAAPNPASVAYAAPVSTSAAYTAAPSPPYSPQAYAGQEYYSGYYSQ